MVMLEKVFWGVWVEMFFVGGSVEVEVEWR